jgi:hypothetical protein
MNVFGKPKANPLIGKWVADKSDAATIDFLGDVELEFSDSGLRYTVRAPEKDQIILMTYKIKGDTIVTDQPSHPSSQTTNIEIDGSSLVLRFDGQPSRFVRAD